MDEGVLVLLGFFFFLSYFVHKIVSYKRWKMERKLEGRGGRRGKEDALTMSELKTFIEHSVLEATLPLEQRIARLEKQLRRQPLPSPEEPVLELPDYDEEEDAAPRSRRRTRQSGRG